MTIIIGSITLTDANSPKVAVKFEYYRTDTDVIIGGKRTFTINGYVSVSDNESQSGAVVMTELKKIRDSGRNQSSNSCVQVVIPDFYSGIARIENINIDQGPDPSWVNQGSFSITVEAPLETIPPNNYGITAQDNVKSLTFSEKIDLGEDSHGFVYVNNNSLSKAFVKFSCRVSVEIDPLCQNINTRASLENIILRFLKTGPTHRLLSKYTSWSVYLQDRSYEITNNNSASFSGESILLHPSKSGSAYIELNFKHNKNYTNNDETKTIAGNIRGLVSIPWSDIATLSSNNSASKISSAEAAFSTITTAFSDISSWDGIDYILTRYNCPPTRPGDSCNANDDPKLKKDCLKPSATSVSRSRTEGSIDFSFDWINSDCAKNNPNSTTIEYSIDDQKMQPTVVDFTIPTVGILLQDLNCYTARRVSFSSTLNFPSANCPQFAVGCNQDDKLEEQITLYFTQRRMDRNDFALTEWSKSRSTKSTVIKKSFISLCQTPLG